MNNDNDNPTITYPLQLRVRDANSVVRYLLPHFVAQPQWLTGYDAICEWLANNDGKSLLLIGGCGVGKSLFAAHIIPYLVKCTLDRTLHTFPARYLSRPDTLRQVEYYRLKGIDDIGTETEISDYGVRRYTFCDIVDVAYVEHQFLVLTTNLSLSMLSDRYGERTMERLQEMCRIVLIEGESQRK